MKKTYQISTLILFTALIIILAACSSDLPTTQNPTATPVDDLSLDVPQQDDVVKVEAAEVEQVANQKPWVEGSSQIDEQGAVVVEIIPLNLNAPEGTLDFQVALNTHSVDLSMDLATLATLETDTGQIAQATLWDAPSGGHHVSGILSFPASIEGISLLDGVSKITIRLINVDSPERIFSWER